MNLPRFPLLSGLYHVVALDDHRVQVANAGRSVVLSGPDFCRRALPLLDALDGATSLDELSGRFPGLVPSLLDALAAKGLLSDAAEGPADAGASPQLAAFAFEGAPSPALTTARLARSQVLVAGCGPVGWSTAVLLGKAGVGRLVVTDPGTATASDVALSSPGCPDDEGVGRAELVRRSCQAATPASVEVLAGPGSGGDLPPVDLAVVELGCGDDVGMDSPGTSLAGLCLTSSVRHLLYGQDALQAVVGPLIDVGGRPCHRCVMTRRLSHVARIDEHMAYRAHRGRAANRPDGFLSAHVSLLAGLVATEALRALLGIQPHSQGNLLIADLGRLSVEREWLLPVPDCPCCAQTSPSVSDLSPRGED